MKSFVLAAIAAVALTTTAQASIIPVLQSVTPNGPNFTFEYDGQLAGDQGVKNGDKLVVIDVAGYVTGSIFSPYATVTPSISNSLPAGLLLLPGFTDDPTIPDLVFTYTGPDYRTSGGIYPLTNFAGLTADSIFSTFETGSFSAQATINNGPETGTTAYNVGRVSVPLASTPVPEPLTLSVFATGLIGAVAMRRRRKAAKA